MAGIAGVASGYVLAKGRFPAADSDGAAQRITFPSSDDPALRMAMRSQWIA